MRRHDTKRLKTLSAAVLLNLVSGFALTCSTAEEGTDDSSAEETIVDDSTKSKTTFSDMREVGIAMMSWLKDRKMRAASAPPVHRDAGSVWAIRSSSATHGTTLTYRPISHAELTKLLVPRYIDAVPEHDGWGHAFVFALNNDLEALNVVGIRSPGRDGRFETDNYASGSFDADAYDSDIVWCDGFFVRWPSLP